MAMGTSAMDSLSGETSALGIKDEPRPHVPFMTHPQETPPAHQIHSPGAVATDITRQFTEAAEKLDVGQLVKDGYFTLFESVGAIEIMDPKMDTGYLAEGESMEDDYDFGRILLPEEVLGIIDQLHCLEMAWHMGHPLSQTLFTSLYIDKILSSSPAKWKAARFDDGRNARKTEPTLLWILRAYCLALIKTCGNVNTRIKSEHFYEEEDFVTHTYSRSLLEDVVNEDILHFLRSAEEALIADAEVESSEVRSALRARLDFRSTFLIITDQVNGRDENFSKVSWEGLLAFLPQISRTRDLGKSVPESFSVKLQRKLASTVPPRPVVDIAFEKAYEHLERLCRDGAALREILTYHDSHSLMTFVLLFQARKPQPSVYIRTLLQFYVFGDMKVLGTKSIRQVLDDDLASLVLAEDQLLDPINDEIEVPQDPRFNMAKRMEIFRERAAHSYLDIIRTLSQNRCRTRRDLTHTVIDWENLQLDAEELDIALREFTKEDPVMDPSVSPDPLFAFPLSSWAYFYKLRQMEWIVQIGFELEVYQPDELAGMYWYLQHLAQTRVRHVERIRGFTMRRFSALGRDRDAGKSKPNPEKDLGFGRALSYINFSMLEATAIQGLADALTCLYTVLNRRSLIPTPPRPYSDDALRYELRMKPFLPIGLPEHLPYDQFHFAVTQPEESSSDLLAFAAEAVARARKDFELLSKIDAKTARCLGCEEAWRKNVKDCLKACIAASICVSVVSKEVGRVGEVEGPPNLVVEIPPVGKGYHEWWVVPKAVLRK